MRTENFLKIQVYTFFYYFLLALTNGPLRLQIVTPCGRSLKRHDRWTFVKFLYCISQFSVVLLFACVSGGIIFLSNAKYCFRSAATIRKLL